MTAPYITDYITITYWRALPNCLIVFVSWKSFLLGDIIAFPTTSVQYAYRSSIFAIVFNGLVYIVGLSLICLFTVGLRLT